jgi:hypothetical protein
MADPHLVTFQSPIEMGRACAVLVEAASVESGGISWTVTFSDSGAGGHFDPPTLLLGDSSSGVPTSGTTSYVPISTGTKVFDFTDNSISPALYDYTPTSLLVNAFDRRRASGFLGFA